MSGAGIDTWSLAWYVGVDTPTARALEARATVASARQSQLLPEPIAGYRVGWFPQAQLAFAEGHPAGAGALARPSSLSAAATGIEAAIIAAGVPLPRNRSRVPEGGRSRSAGRAGVRRLDSALDLRFDDRAVGLAVLDALAEVDAPRSPNKHVHTNKGRTETVSLGGYASHRIVARVYDKGVESGTAPPGQVVRLEDQRRFQAGRRPAVDQLTPATVHQLFARRFSFLVNAETVTVGDLYALGDRVAELVDAGKIAERQARRVLGFLMLERHDGAGLSRRTRYRRHAELRQLGLLLVQQVRDVNGEELRGRVDVPLAAVFEAALGPEAWADVQRQARAA